jgi:hypothetical protein
MGTIEPPIVSHLLKIKLYALRQKVKRKIISPKEARRALYEDCKINQDLYRRDLHQIFRREIKKVSRGIDVSHGEGY